MSRASFTRRLMSVTVTLLLGSYTLGNPSFADSTTTEKKVAANKQTAVVMPNLRFGGEYSRQMFNILAGELYRKQGALAPALQYYSAAALSSTNTAIAEQAVELALEAGDNEQSRRIIDHWAKLAPQSFDVHQSRALVMARAGDYDRALDDLVYLRNEVEKKEKHGFEYIISLVTLELGPERSYEIFKRYAEKVESNLQVQVSLANLAFSAGNFDAVLTATDAITKLGGDAEKEQAAHLRAKAFMRKNDVEEALAAIEPFIKKTKNDEIKLDYAKMLILLDRRDEATPWFKQLYASQPDNDGILYTLGLLYLEQKEYAFAEPLIRKLLDIPARQHDASYFLGQVYEGQKRINEALKFYEAALPSTNFISEALSRAANLIQDRDGIDKAVAWLDQQRKIIIPINQKANNLLIKAQLLQDAGRPNEALVALNRANKMRPKHHDTLYMRSLAYERTGDFPAAEKDLQAILKENPDHAAALNALGYLLTINTQRYEQARQFIQRAQQLSPDDPAIKDSLGWVEYRLGNISVAEEILRQAFSALPDPEVASHLIEVLSSNGKLDEAKQLLQDMLAKYPNDPLLMAIKEKVIGLK